MRRLLTFIPLLVILTLLVTAVPAAARSQITLGISDPAGKDLAVLQAHIDLVGQRPRMWSLWSDWGGLGGRATCQQGYGTCSFPRETAKELLGQGITPVIWWQPHKPGFPYNARYSRYKRIATGQHDAYIARWARDLKRASVANGGRPIIVRFAHEASGTWFPWSIRKFDNTMGNYKQAWRRIDNVFKKVGARKYARFMWSNVTPTRKAYPGDRVVDYVGATVLNFGATQRHKWRSMTSRVDQVVRLTRRFTRKPIILSEVASGAKGGNKAGWLRTGYVQTYNRYPQVKGIMYLDTDQPHIGRGHPDWRLIKPEDGATLADGSAVRSYRALANNPRFKGRIK